MNERELNLILKAILNDRTDELAKIDLLFQLEAAEVSVQGLNAAIGVLRILQKSDLINDPLRMVRAQALQTTTTLLLAAHEKNGTDPAVQLLIAPFTESLLSFCNGSDANLKTTAALCLSEIQLCFPGLIGPCVAVVDTLAAFEASSAHQPLLQLLSLLATEEQTAAFLASQLPLLSTPAAASVASHLATLNFPFLLQTYLNQQLISFSLTAIAQASKLADILDEFGRRRLLNHILSLGKDSGLPAASRLVLLDVGAFLGSRHSINYTAPEINYADGAHSKLKKVAMRLALRPVEAAALEGVLEEATRTPNKAVNAKILYLASKHEQLNELSQRLILSASGRDLSFAPHLIQLLETAPTLEPTQLFSSILAAPPPPAEHLPFLLLLLKQAVASRSSTVTRPKESLKLVAHCVSTSPAGLSPALAHQLLSICHQIIKVFDPADFSSEMASLLAAVATKCSEEDVVARVASFESLLGCLADSKVREVLRAQKKGLVPGLFHRPQALIILDRPLLSLQVAKSLTAPVATDLLDTKGKADDPLATYWPLISSRDPHIKIPVNIVSETNETLEAVAIFFEPLLPFAQIKTLLLGQLSTKKKMLVKISPERPYPMIFSSRAEFRKNGRSCCCALPNLTISLAALLQPLLGGNRKQVAKAMWDQMSDWPTASIVLAQEQAKTKIKEMRPFQVINCMMAAFLAPSSHLLIKFSSLEEANVKFDVKTDDVILLAHANDFILRSK